MAAPLQVGNGLEQRHHHEAVVVLDRRAGRRDQAGFLLQHHHFQQVAQRLGVGHDGLAHRLLAVARPAGRGGAQQLAGGVLAVRDPRRGQRARLRQLGAQQRHARVLVQRQVVQRLALVLRAGAGEQFGQRALVHVGTLAQVHRGEVKAKLPPPAAARPGAAARAVVGGQRLGDQRQVGGEGLGAVIGLGRHGAAAGQVLAGQDLGGGGQAGVHADQRAAVGLVGAVRESSPLWSASACRSGRRRSAAWSWTGPRPARGPPADSVRTAPWPGAAARVPACRRRRWDCRRGRRRSSCPCAGTAPAAGRRGEGLGRFAVQEARQVAVQARNRLQEGAAVIRQRVLDLVGHRQAGVAQHAGLPQRGHAA